MIQSFLVSDEDPETVENFKVAQKSLERYEIHHRLETHKWSKKRKKWIQRDESIPANVLIALGLYYNRPAKELIYMTATEHTRLHNLLRPKELYAQIAKSNTGQIRSEEVRRKISKRALGRPSPRKGCILSEETRLKISESLRRRPPIVRTASWKQHISEALKGMCWYNNGIVSIRSKECPEGFVPGRLVFKSKESRV